MCETVSKMCPQPNNNPYYKPYLYFT